MAFPPINSTLIGQTFWSAQQCSSDEDRDVILDDVAPRTNTLHTLIAQHLQLNQDEVGERLAALTRRRRGKRTKPSVVAPPTESVSANTAQSRRSNAGSRAGASTVISDLESFETRPRHSLRTRQLKGAGTSIEHLTSGNANRSGSTMLSDQAPSRKCKSTGMPREVVVKVSDLSTPSRSQCLDELVLTVPDDDEEAYPDDWDCLGDDITDEESHLSLISSTRLDKISRSHDLRAVAEPRTKYINSPPHTIQTAPENQMQRMGRCLAEDFEAQFDNGWTLIDDDVLGSLASASETTPAGSAILTKCSTVEEQWRESTLSPGLYDEDIDIFESMHDANAELSQILDAAIAPPSSPTHTVAPRGICTSPNTSRPHTIPMPPDLQAPTPPPLPFVRDRSPIVGLSASTVLAVCFRNTDALAAGCSAVRTPLRDVVIELFSRVRKSARTVIPAVINSASGRVEAAERHVQHFELADLYDDDEAKVLRATFEGWHDIELFDADARPFLEAGKKGVPPIMCRVIGRIERKGAAWVLRIASIWVTDRADVEWVRGIICADSVC